MRVRLIAIDAGVLVLAVVALSLSGEAHRTTFWRTVYAANFILAVWGYLSARNSKDKLIFTAHNLPVGFRTTFTFFISMHGWLYFDGQKNILEVVRLVEECLALSVLNYFMFEYSLTKSRLSRKAK